MTNIYTSHSLSESKMAELVGNLNYMVGASATTMSEGHYKVKKNGDGYALHRYKANGDTEVIFHPCTRRSITEKMRAFIEGVSVGKNLTK